MFVMNWFIWFKFNSSTGVSLRLLLISKIFSIFVSILFLVIYFCNYWLYFLTDLRDLDCSCR